MLKDSRSSKVHPNDEAAEYPAPAVRAARRATYAMFFADGIGFGIWAGHIPALKQKFQLSDSALSIVLLAVAAGSIVSMPLAGQAVRHFGSRRCIAVSIACYGMCLVAIAFAPSLLLFVLAALLFGAAKGVAGLGNSNLVPILFSAAGRNPILGPGPGIAAVTTVGFFGFLVGPAVIGLMSKFFGLSVALSLLVLLSLITAAWGPAIVQSHALSRTNV